MSNPKKQFQIYFAGASLSFGLPFFLVELISLFVGEDFFNEYSVIFGFIYISLHLLGGLLGGALVSRKVEKADILRSAATSGLLAYILHQVIYYLFYGVSVVGDTYTLFSLLGGSVVGALYTRQKRSKETEQDEEKEEEDLSS
jgi:hypothetical protein